MVRFIQNMFKGLLVKKSSAVASVSPTLIDVPDLAFKDLRNNLTIRTFGFDSYVKLLEKYNLRLLHWIGSVAYSGHVRERSLKYLIENYQLGDENRILLRLEDWVPEIQTLAEKWVFANFGELDLEQIDNNHELIQYLARKEKLKHSDVIAFINECLAQKVEQLTDEEFNAYASAFRKYLFPLAQPNNTKLRKWMLHDKNPHNRLIILDVFSFKELSDEERRLFTKDRSSLVKRRYLSFQISNNVTPTQQDLTNLVMDNNRGTRDFAKYYLLKYYNVDAYEIYNKEEKDNFYFIADYSKKEDLDCFMDGMNSENKRVVLLCLKAICNIDHTHLVGLNIRQLVIGDRRTRDIVSRYLPDVLSLKQLESYRDTFSKVTTNGSLIYLNMIFAKSLWSFVDSSLSLLMEDASDVNVRFISHRFYNKSQITEALTLRSKESILSKADKLENTQNYRLRELVERIRFAMNYVKCEH